MVLATEVLNKEYMDPAGCFAAHVPILRVDSTQCGLAEVSGRLRRRPSRTMHARPLTLPGCVDKKAKVPRLYRDNRFGQ